MRWAIGLIEQRVDTRTPDLMAALKRKDYEAAAELLEFMARTIE